MAVRRARLVSRPRARAARRVAGLAAALALTSSAACGGSGAETRPGDSGSIDVVTTVAPITSIVSAVAGDRAHVTGLIPEGVDSHTWEPTPSAARAVADADLIVLNGLGLDDAVAELAERAGGHGDLPLIRLGDEAVPAAERIFDRSFPREGGRPNPHTWTDPLMGAEYARLAGEQLAAVDPAGADDYRRRANEFGERAVALDGAIRAALDTVPAEARALVTYHDAYAYVARRYDWPLVAAVQPADMTEPSPADVADLIEQISDAGAPAVFGSDMFPSAVLRRIARETGATWVTGLSDDDLPGEPGDPENTWFALVAENFVIITRALGGDPSPLEPFTGVPATVVPVVGVPVVGVPVSTAAPIVRLRGVTCGYDGPPVIESVDLSLGAGDFIGVVGPSGAGKTTLVRTVLGTITPRSGSVERAPGRQVAYVPQLETVDWSFPITVRDCVLMARPRRLPWSSAAERREADDLLERLGIAGLGDRHIAALSGGQQQRVFLARALLRAPDLLVLDEPTAGVDVRTRHEVLHLLRDLHREGLGILLTTHDLNGMAAHLPSLVCLNRRIVALGPPAEVLTPDTIEATYGARMDVLLHAGMPVVVDPLHPDTHPGEGVGAERGGIGDGSGAGDDSGTGDDSEIPDRRSPADRPMIAEIVSRLGEAYGYGFFRDGLLVATLAGASCGLVGVFVVLRGMSYLGHGLSHAVFVGYAAAALIGLNPIVGAAAWGVGAVLAIDGVTRRRRVGSDAAIGVVTTASFALGLVLIGRSGAGGRNAEAVLFGNVLGVSRADVLLVAGVSIAAVLLVGLRYRDLLFCTFDPDVARASGVPVGRVDALLMLVLAASVLAGLRVLGAMLVAAAVVIPPVAARLLTDSFPRLVLLATAIGAASGFVGMHAAYLLDIATGPVIVLTATCWFAGVWVIGARRRPRAEVAPA